MPGDRVRLPGHAGEADAAAAQLPPQLLHEDALAADQLGRTVGPLGAAAALRIGAGDGHPHGRAALDADQHDIGALLHAQRDHIGDGGGDPRAVPPEGGGVVLLAYRPEPVQASERELRAGHLLDPPALLPQHVDDRGVDPGAVGAVADLGVLIKHAMCHERNAHEPSIRPGRLPRAGPAVRIGAMTDSSARQVAGPERDFVGYGPEPPRVRWPAGALERNPPLCDWLRDREHDVLGHGYRWYGPDAGPGPDMTREQERTEIAMAVESVQRTTGQRLRGWMVRSFATVHTRELLAADGGFRYDSDASNDELPYFVVPYTKVHNDVRYLIPPSYSTPRHFCESLRLSLDYLLEEARAGLGGRLMSVGVHARWSGQPGRAAALRDFVEYALGQPDVAFMRRIDIADFWASAFPPR